MNGVEPSTALTTDHLPDHRESSIGVTYEAVFDK